MANFVPMTLFRPKAVIVAVVGHLQHVKLQKR